MHQVSTDFPPGRAEFVAAAAPPVAPWNVKTWMSDLGVESEDAVKADARSRCPSAL